MNIIDNITRVNHPVCICGHDAEEHEGIFYDNNKGRCLFPGCQCHKCFIDKGQITILLEEADSDSNIG